MSDIDEFLSGKGFKTYGPKHDGVFSWQAYWKSLDNDVPECERNEKPPQLDIRTYGATGHKAVSITIRAEVADIWASVGADTMRPDEFIENYDQVVEATKQAWTVFYKAMKEE